MLPLLLTVCLAGADPTPEPLWPNGAPLAVGMEDKDKPSITAYLPEKDKATGAAVVVCPGGGYSHLAMGHEGKEVAEWLNARGVAAFVLQYRLAPRYAAPAPMLDAQRAIRTVRHNAEKLHLDPKKVGIWGFSAGGHLASTAGTHFDAGKADAEDPIDRVSCRPDFLILAYPVISMEPRTTHGGSRKNLLGAEPTRDAIKLYNNHEQVTKETPPTFLFHTNQDAGVLPENSVLFYLALRKAGVPAELHVYERGKHGIGLGKQVPGTSSWPNRLADWMKLRELVK